jgi:hypothetical protein
MQQRNDFASGCSGKRQYPTKQAAVTASLSLGKRAPSAKATAYYCAMCGGFHFGRKGTHDQRAEKASKDANMLELFTSKKAPPARVAEEVQKEAASHRELSWLAQRVAQGQKQPFSEIVTITPSIAKHILERNDDNRKVRAALVQQIAADISANRWDLNGEAIIIAKDGTLNDGQHRLNAIIEANKSVQTLVVFGVARDSRYTVDMGAARSVGDFLGMEGAKYWNEAAAIAKMYLIYRKGFYAGAGVEQRSLFTKAAVRAEYWQHEKAINAAIDEIVNTPFAKAVGKSPIAVAHVILTKLNKEAAAYFFAKLLAGDGLKKGDAILALRERLIASPEKRMRPYEKLEMILRHWNAWRRGEALSRYKQMSAYPKLER